MINDLKKSGEWKIHLTMKMNFTWSKNSNEKRLIDCKKDNKEIISDFNIKEIIEELFHSLLQRHKVGLEQSTKVRDFMFDYVEG